ncbi:MAG: SdrD B-like domain-containing protein, partial [Acidobacteriota bacterium]
MTGILILSALLGGSLAGFSSPRLLSDKDSHLFGKLGDLLGNVGLVLPVTFQSASINMTTTVSSCYYTSGQSRKTVSVEVAWSSLPNPVTTITVSLPGAIGSTTRTISAQTTGNPPIESPQVVAFEIPSTFTGALTVSDSANSVSGNTINLNETGTCAPLVCAANDIAGTVYSDYNGDGSRNPGDNPGVANVTVTGYDRNGQTYTTTSNNEGKYCLTVPTASYPVRVEFTNLSRSSGRVGANSASSVQFLAAPSQSVDLSISSPDGYCETNPWVMTSCFVFGDPLPQTGTPSPAAGLEPAMVRARYSQSGIKTGVQPFANASEVGAIWGLAYHKQSDRLFTSAILRRHTGFGPRGLGGIYILNPNSSSATISASGNVVDSWSVVNQLGVDVDTPGSIFAGTSGATSNASRGLVGDPTQPSRDIDAFAKVGKAGLGDIDLTPDGNTLFFVNQYDQKLYSVDITGYNPANTATRPTAANVNSKDTTPAVPCQNGQWRPSALKVTAEYAYVGGVCDGSTGTRSDLRAKVQRISISGGASWATQAWTTVLDLPLTYPKGYPHGVFKDLSGADSVKMWRTWTDNFFDLEIRPNPTIPAALTPTIPVLIVSSVPMLSDIEIDVDGSIILSLGDRTGLQTGNANYGPVATGSTTLATTDNQILRSGSMTASDNALCPIQFSGTRNLTGNTFYTNAVGGDILRGLITGSSFIIENGGRVGPLTGASTSNNEGPGFGEFYSDNFSWPAAPAPPRQFCGVDPHTEISMGALAILPGSGEVVMTAMDPRNQTAGETTQINAGGFRYLSNLNGAEARSLVLYSLGDDQSAQLGKSSGLGDIELSCGVINYLEIGNRLWADTDGDGVQDPGEPGIAGIQVTLFQGG